MTAVVEPKEISAARDVMACPKCGGVAPFVRVAPEASASGNIEVRQFVCITCDHVSNVVAPPHE